MMMQRESGYHSSLWFDLETLFTDSRSIAPFVDALTNAIRPYDVAAVCGALVGGAFLAQLVAPALGVDFCFTERVTTPHNERLFHATYRLPPALRAHVRGKRVAIVDDVMSAGSALRGTYAELCAQGADVVVAGALLVLGSKGGDFFAERGVPVEAVARDEFEMWDPANCPLCAAGAPLEDRVTP